MFHIRPILHVNSIYELLKKQDTNFIIVTYSDYISKTLFDLYCLVTYILSLQDVNCMSDYVLSYNSCTDDAKRF